MQHPPPPGMVRAHIERLRKICERYPEVVEVTQFGHPWWKAGKKSFCLYGAENGVPGACFNLTREEQLILLDDPRFSRAHYIGHHGWTTLRLGKRVDWEEVEELVDSAYRKVALKRMLKVLDG